jgi:hypothetical protein
MNMNKRYFEIEFDNEPRGREWNENCVGDYSICIIGKREPSFEEAEQFCKSDMEKTGYKYVVGVTEIDAEEAHNFFDMEQEDKFPVFE